MSILFIGNSPITQQSTWHLNIYEMDEQLTQLIK